MNGTKEIPAIARNGISQQPADDAVSFFRRRTFSNWRWSCPRRYIMGILLGIFLTLNAVRDMHASYALYCIVLLKATALPVNPIVRHWTVQGIQNIEDGVVMSDIFAQLIGGLLIYVFSSHKFLLVAAIGSSIMHMLIPFAANFHSIVLLAFAIFGQGTLTVPVYTAIFSLLKDWTPHGEKPRLVSIWLCGIFAEFFTQISYSRFSWLAKDTSIYGIGTAGIVWALFWYFFTSDTPQNDPLMSENEFLYLESNIPTDIQEKIKLKDVPWISIGKSLQVLILCLIFFKFSFSIETIKISWVVLKSQLFGAKENNIPYYVPSFSVAFILCMLGSALLLNFLTERYRSKTLLIRKIFLCGGFILQSLLMFGVCAPLAKVKVIFFMLAYCIFAFSVPSFLTYPLDLSPRYVSLIAGVGFTFFSTATLCSHYFIKYLSWTYRESFVQAILLVDGIMSLIIAIVFGIWGDVEEQQWSLISSSHPRTNKKSFSQRDHEEDLNLISDTL